MPVANAIREILEVIYAKGGTLQFPQDDPPPFRADLLKAAERANLLRWQDGGTWGVQETLSITREGMRAIGAEPAPTLLDRIRGFLHGRERATSRR